MGLRHQRRATWQDEVLQRPQFFVPYIDGRFEPLHLSLVQGLVAGHRQLATKVEQAMLAWRQNTTHLIQLVLIQAGQ